MMKRSFIQLSFSVVVGLTVGLAGTLYLSHRGAAPPASESMRVSVPPLRPEAPGLPALADERGSAASARATSDPTAPMPLSAVVALRQEVAHLRREIAAVQRQLHEAGPRGAAEREAAPAPDPPPDRLAARATADREWQQQLAGLEAAFRREPVNAQWAAEAAGAVQAALASDDTVQNLLLGLDCRANTCRVELAEDDTGELAQALPLLLMQLAPTLPRSTVQSAIASVGGGQAMVLYLSRETPAPPAAGQ